MLNNEKAERRKELLERAKYFAELNAIYGFEFISSSDVYKNFEEIINPERLGFSVIKNGYWGKVINDEIVQLMKLMPMKGTSYMLQWGVSLLFMPGISKTKLKWHKTFKSSQFDLWCVSMDYYPVYGENWLQGEKCLIHSGNGEQYLKESIKIMWQRLGKRVTEWYQSSQSLTDILKKANEQVENKSKWANHSPNPFLVYVFVLGRIGRTEEAQIALIRYFEKNLEPPEIQSSIKIALAELV